MKKPIFKKSDDVINWGAMQIHQGNITPELYKELIRAAPSHADHFTPESLEAMESEEEESSSSQEG